MTDNSLQALYPVTAAYLPPQSLEAERSVLGAAMQGAAFLLEVLENLSPEDFYHAQHTLIFEAMRSLSSQVKAVDLVTLDAELQRNGKLEVAGGSVYLVDLMQAVPTTVNLSYYIQIVAEKATLRKLIKASETIIKNCHEQRLSLEDILLQAQGSIFDIAMRRSGGDTLRHISEVLKGTYSIMDELARNKGSISGVATGFYDLDNALTGLHPGELIVLGARPGMGKTSFVMNVASYAAHHGKTIAIFSLEMPSEHIALRMLCGDARVDMQKVRKGSLRDEDWVKMAGCVSALSGTRVYMDDSGSLKISQLRSRCRRLMMEQGRLDLVVIDYMQLMLSDGKTENRQQEVSEISRKLKSIALELKIPILACAQLSRASTKLSNGQPVNKVAKPVLSDLRDSGSIEQDADVVIFLHRPGYYAKDNPEVDQTLAEVIIAKQRNGPLDTIKLTWLAESTLFDNRYETSKGDQ